jgi:hypothetical protein
VRNAGASVKGTAWSPALKGNRHCSPPAQVRPSPPGLCKFIGSARAEVQQCRNIRDEARGAATMQPEPFSEISRNSQFPGPKYFANEIFLVLQELISILRQGLRQRYQHPSQACASFACVDALPACIANLAWARNVKNRDTSRVWA